MLACNCLNVMISRTGGAAGDPPGPTVKDTGAPAVQQHQLDVDEMIAVHERLPHKDFICLKESEVTISSTYLSFVDSQPVGLWTVSRCFNCDTCTHALNTKKGFALINANLLNSQHIEELRKSSHFSNVFNIVIDMNIEEDNNGYDCIKDEEERTIGTFKAMAHNVIEKEIQLMEEKIRVYTEQQHTALDEFRDRVWKEQKALTRVLLKTSVGSPISLPPADPSSPTLTKSPKGANKVPDLNAVESTVKTPQKRLVDRPDSQKNSFDAEGLFELDMDLDNGNYEGNSDGGDASDGEDKEHEETAGGIQIKQTTQGHQQQVNMAKSFPMNIPAFLENYSSHSGDDHDDSLCHSENPKDIAASIKALARSVCGDTIFGELPKPRCSTNI